jgi:hypothetical protein
MDRRSLSEDAPEVPLEGASARQGRCRPPPAGPSPHNPDRPIRWWSRRSAVGAVGQQMAATGVRNNRRVCSETVEDHDRRFWHRRPLTWRSSHAFTVLNRTQFHVRRLGGDLARRKPGVQIPSSTPQTDPIVEVPTEIHRRWSSGVPCAFRSDRLSQLAPSSRPVSRAGPVNLAAALRRHARDPTRPPGHPRDQPRMKRTSPQNAGALAASVWEPTSTQR